jgi:hypothetical protein
MLSEKHCDLCWRGQLTTDVKSRWVEEDEVQVYSRAGRAVGGRLGDILSARVSRGTMARAVAYYASELQRIGSLAAFRLGRCYIEE